jgi:hypothetical protein
MLNGFENDELECIDVKLNDNFQRNMMGYCWIYLFNYMC